MFVVDQPSSLNRQLLKPLQPGGNGGPAPPQPPPPPAGGAGGGAQVVPPPPHQPQQHPQNINEGGPAPAQPVPDQGVLAQGAIDGGRAQLLPRRHRRNPAPARPVPDQDVLAPGVPSGSRASLPPPPQNNTAGGLAARLAALPPIHERIRLRIINNDVNDLPPCRELLNLSSDEDNIDLK